MKVTLNEISFHHERSIFTLIFIVGEMKFTLGMVGVKRPIENINNNGRGIEISILHTTMQTFIEGFF